MKSNLSSFLVSNALFFALFSAIFLPGNYGVNAQTAPSISYTTPQVLVKDIPVTINPTNSGGTVPSGTYTKVSAFAGSSSASGSTGGTGTAARFNKPVGIAIDPTTGDMYVADTWNHLIRKVTSGGLVTTIAGTGSAGFSNNSTGTSAQFNFPTDLAIHPDGTCLYVADKLNHVIRKISLTGSYAVTTFAGVYEFNAFCWCTVGGSTVGTTGLDSKFNQPEGIFFDGSNSSTHYLYIADRANHKIRRITLSTTSGSTATAGQAVNFAGEGSSGSTEGAVGTARFNNPVQVAVSANGSTVYVADFGNNKIRQINSNSVSTLAGSGTAGGSNGTGGSASFNGPYGIEVDGAGNIIVSEQLGHRIRRIKPDGEVSTLAGSGTAGTTDGVGALGLLNEPSGMVFNPASGMLYICEYATHRIRRLDMSGYTISSTLPTNLTMDATTGIISGTPNTLTGTNPYTGTVTAYNYYGSSSTTLTVEVVNLPAVTTTASVSSITASGASSGGNVTLDGGSAVTARGVVWSTTTGPTVSLSTKTADGTGTGSFTSTITGLSPNTTYYVRAYATTAAGTAYGSEVSFTTLPMAPSISYSSSSVTLKLGSPANITLTNTGGTPDLVQVGTLAGSGISGYADGTGTAAQFRFPYGVAVDGSGNVYVAEQVNHRIRKITSAGVVSTLAGSTAGYADGTGTAAKFSNPAGVAVDNSGNVYVADQSNNRIRKVTSEGVVTTLAGSTQGFADGNGISARFYNPSGVAVDSSGNVYVADQGNNLIRKITPAGVVTRLAGGGTGFGIFADGNGISARFFNPNGVAVDGSGNVYVAEYSNHSIRKITPAGVVSTLAGSGTATFADGAGTSARFYNPTGVAVDGSGNVYVADFNNNRIRKITPAGEVTTLAGSSTGSFADGTGTDARFSGPYDVAMDASGNLYVADQNNSRIRIISSYRIDPALPAGLFFDARTGTITGTPIAVSAARTYTVYAQNSVGSTTTQITLSVVAPPTATTQAATNVTATSATLNATVNANGETTSALTIKYSTVQATVDAGSGTSATVSPTSATGNTNTAVSAAITGLPASTTYYYRVSATNSAGTTNGATLSFTTTPAAPIIGYAGASSPVTLSVGTVMTPLTVTNNGGAIEPMQVSTLAGRNSAFADGTGTAASFRNPSDVAVDGSGNVYVADRKNERIRKIVLSTGEVTTLAGPAPGVTPASGYLDGTGAAARFFNPTGVAVDGSGNVYVADEVNHRIRKVTSKGEVTTLAGSGTGSFADGTGAAAGFWSPTGLAVDGSGNIYVADKLNHRIRKIVLSTGEVTTLAGSTEGFADGTGTVAKFNYPAGVAVDGSGNIYVADNLNNRIRKIVLSTGEVTTLAGSGTAAFADGTGTFAQFRAPTDVAVDGSGNLYVADQSNHRIRKIVLSTGEVTTLAGRNSAFADGTGAAARFKKPFGVAVDNSGNIYVADQDNDRIRRISRYSISPALPAGLTFDPATGTISGTPTAITASQTYTVTASNGGGNGTTNIILSVSSSMLTTAASAITETTATTGGTVDATQFAGATQKGVCWNTTGNPEITDPKTTEGSGTGVFTSNLTGLAPNTTYYLRSYVTVGSTTTYGNEVSFKTKSTTAAMSNVTKTFGDPAFIITNPAANNSAGGWSYSSGNTGVATIVGNTVTIAGAGTSTITATQAASGAYGTTTSTFTLTVNPLATTISLNIPSTTPLKEANGLTITPTATGGGPVTLSLGTGSVSATLSGTAGSTYSLSNVAQTGNLVFEASVPATGNYAAATLTQTMDVTKNNQVITFNPLPAVTYSNGLTQTLTATGGGSGEPVVFSVVSGPGSTSGTNGTTLNISGPGSILIKASQAGAGNYNAAADVERTLTVNPAAPSITNFTPTSAKEGDVVTINGQHFQNVTAVSFGGTAATSFTVVSSTEIRAVLGTGHTGQVSVTTASGTDTEAGFRYKVQWTGATNAFSSTGNWSGGRVPQDEDDIEFSTDAASDIELDGHKTVGNVNFNGSSKSLKLGAYNLTVKGNLTMPGNITGSGKVIMQGGSAQTIRGGGDIPDLEIDNSAGVTIDPAGDELTVSGTLRSKSGVLNTNGKLRLTSNSGGTARVGVVTGTIMGNVIAERYIQRNNNSDGTGRAWRLVSVPVTGTGTLRDFFMNGRNGQDLTLQASRDAETENSGTPIVGHNYADAASATTAGSDNKGFDWIGVANQVSSLRSYVGDAAGGSFLSENVPDLTTTYTSAAQGYMVFTRGDRKLDFPSTTSSGSTTFRSTGTLKTGTQTVNLEPASTSKYTLVGNPYMCVLNLAAFYSTNSSKINPSFWIWDANISGTNRQGGYVNVFQSNGQWVTNMGSYINPELLESGMAFFVEPKLSTATTINIEESHKSSASAAGLSPFSTDKPDDHGRMYVRLERADDKGRRHIIDGVMADFHTSFNEALTDMSDREKLRNGISRGALWIPREGKSLSGEGLPWPKQDKRTIPLSMSGVGDQTLVLRIDPRGMEKRFVKVWLRDKVLKREEEVNMIRGLDYDFIGTGRSDWDSTRFELVYVEAGRPSTAGVALEPDGGEGSPSVRLYPNPTRMAQVRLSLRSLPAGAYTVQLLDMTGRLVATEKLDHRSPNGEYRLLQGRQLSPGKYLVRLVEGNRLVSTLPLIHE